MRISKRIAKSLLSSIKQLTDVELEQLKNDCHQLSRTNCWWLEYDCASIFMDLAANEQNLRADQSAQQAVAADRTTDADNDTPVGGG